MAPVLSVAYQTLRFAEFCINFTFKPPESCWCAVDLKANRRVRFWRLDNWSSRRPVPLPASRSQYGTFFDSAPPRRVRARPHQCAATPHSPTSAHFFLLTVDVEQLRLPVQNRGLLARCAARAAAPPRGWSELSPKTRALPNLRRTGLLLPFPPRSR